MQPRVVRYTRTSRRCARVVLDKRYVDLYRFPGFRAAEGSAHLPSPSGSALPRRYLLPLLLERFLQLSTVTGSCASVEHRTIVKFEVIFTELLILLDGSLQFRLMTASLGNCSSELDGEFLCDLAVPYEFIDPRPYNLDNRISPQVGLVAPPVRWRSLSSERCRGRWPHLAGKTASLAGILKATPQTSDQLYQAYAPAWISASTWLSPERQGELSHSVTYVRYI